MRQLSYMWDMEFIESQYQLFQKNPENVSKDWQYFFQGFDLGLFQSQQKKQKFQENKTSPEISDIDAILASKIEQMIFYYRHSGHLHAKINPLYSETSQKFPNLAQFGLTESDLTKKIRTSFGESTSSFNQPEIILKDLIEDLQTTYCQSTGVEYMQIQDQDARIWLANTMESKKNKPNLTSEEKIRNLHKLYQAGIFEHFLHNRYIGQKRFSLEGCEVLISMLDVAIDRMVESGCQEIVIGMAHRGRLNVLVNTLWKLYEDIFCEFDDNFDPQTIVGSSDVRYHKGYFSTMKTRSGQNITLLLSPNPSHLEAVNPVVEGIVRARQFATQDKLHNLVVPLLIHGDAAFAGQGVVPETLNLSQLEGYITGGTLHIIINNQIGFTTLPQASRSTKYATDVAKMLMVPIFHVNAEDSEAVWYVMQLAVDYRMRFHTDVIIDLICYRRYGHNESDEPMFTQPKMYDLIQKKATIYEIYGQKLKEQNILSEENIIKIRQDVELCIEEGFKKAHAMQHQHSKLEFYPVWNNYHGKYSNSFVPTGLPQEILLKLSHQVNEFPSNFHLHPKLKKVFEKRLLAWQTGIGIDWSNAESMAFATLLHEGQHIRFTGQDTRRGTFSQRHAALYDFEDGKCYIPLQSLYTNKFEIYDSPLSEEAVLSFEYGYSLTHPQYLVIWEAQFGDFANGAQVVVDQFISSGESKWNCFSGIVMLLPHGYEGQGPEHSSARLERYLSLCAEDNMQICNITTPAQYFHILRRQICRENVRKPLIIMTPKSLLRHPQVASSIIDFCENTGFQEVLDDENITPNNIEKIIFCSGKIYYDLLAFRSRKNVKNTAILRIEQLYPFPMQQIQKILEKYHKIKQYFWVQEEPQNMGAWLYIQQYLQESISVQTTHSKIIYIGRSDSASPATGSSKIHEQEQRCILEGSFL